MASADYEITVLGGGSAGFAAARAGADAGLKTLLVDGAEELGGLCILRGCMPTKAMLYSAEIMHLAKNSAIFGVETSGVRANFEEIMARKRRLVDDFASYRRKQLRNGPFDFIHAHAQFVDPHTLQLGNGRTVRSEHIVLATGSQVAPSPLPELNSLEYITSDNAVCLKSKPRSLIVLGGGPVALEFAQFFARIDVKTTLIQRSSHVLSDMDEDAARVIETVFKREGIDVHTNTSLTGGNRGADGKTVSFIQNGKTKHVTADEVLFALGRITNVEGLALDRAGVEHTRRGIKTDAFMRTNVPHIYAVGDCNGKNEIVHVAIQQAELAIHNIRQPNSARQFDERLNLLVVFTDPQLAVVGMTEHQAKIKGIEYLAASYPFNDHGKSLIMEALDGHVKLLAHPKTGEILGGACVGPAGGDLIHEVAMAMAKRMTVAEFSQVPHYHPTLSEIWMYPAEELAQRVGE